MDDREGVDAVIDEHTHQTSSFGYFLLRGSFKGIRIRRIRMGTRNVRLDEDVYERIKSEKRPDETFSDAVDRLIGGSSLLDLAGILNDEEADEFRRAIDRSDAAGTREIDELVDRFDGDDDS